MRQIPAPQVTPKMAPAAESEEGAPICTRIQARARPTTSLPRASMIWETAVGTMLEWPCAYPRKVERTHTKKQAGAMACTAWTAMPSPWRSARGWASRNMTAKLTVPRTKKAARATLKIRRTWLRRPRALASAMLLDRATGRPAVDTISSRL